MLFYLAPMEGMTGYVVRNAFHHHFHTIDRYFTPFIPANKKMNHKFLCDISPENNKEITVIPQLMANQAKDVLEKCEQLATFGYDTFNLNLGCPSKTVVTKKRGAGFLAYPDELDAFLYELFSQTPYKISIKTRIGMENDSHWEQILSIYQKYPLEELIIHPRTQSDFYQGALHYDAFALATDSKFPICFNGDITDCDSFQSIRKQFPTVTRFMIGRGLFRNPGLIGELLGQKPAGMNTLRAFHDEIVEGYCSLFSGEKDVLFHMKEIWSYLGTHFHDCDKAIKGIRKAQTLTEYLVHVNSIL